MGKKGKSGGGNNDAMMKMMQMMMAKMTQGKQKGGGKWGSKGAPGKMSLGHFPADKKVWVGDIPDGVTNRELHEHFKEAGAKWSEAYGGNSKGTGGVAFKTAEEATSAISTLNGSLLKGSAIVVDVWTKKE
eukprot:gnl/MRDRNA2_/MRDRNA2_60065_c0_seq2.p1 gnl/MRDRNA2_/MRDRNA2_60065_c0~~gnl/MRDRNA2_/MRDRNA2_60065_c0_seq2.p1  ORF type:complete len:131 (+),score=42.68 gnl/MRDRNA2_/MRDRNA2_60065_c0_seq2:87-479(+)